MGYLHINNLYKDQTILLFKECYALEKIHGCVRGDTKIALPNGEEVEIKDIKIGDLVLSFDEKTGGFVSKSVLNVIVQPITNKLKWYKLTLENGRELICTENHPILTKTGWITAKNLSEKDEIVDFYV